MITKPATILAVDPGTRELGVALLSGQSLIYYGVKTIRQRQSPQSILGEIARVISRLIADYEPTVLAIEKTFLIQKSAALLNVAAAEIKAVARQAGLPIYEYTPSEVRKLVCQTGKATKRETALEVAARFPELSHYLKQQTKWEELYYANMFDAIAVGLKCSADITRPPANINEGEGTVL